jgi:hypothetical protein
MAEPLAIKIRRVGERRTGLLRRLRPEYEIVIMDGDVAVFSGTTVTPSSVLVSQGKVHTTDSWDWINAADSAYSLHSEAWTTGW